MRVANFKLGEYIYKATTYSQKKVSMFFVHYLHGHSLNLNGFWLRKQLGVSSPQGECTSSTDRKTERKEDRQTLEFLLSHLPMPTLIEHAPFNSL